MSKKLVNIDLDEEQLALLNWLLEEPSEIRFAGDNDYLIFLSEYQLEDFWKLCGDGWFDDGAQKLHFNGTDYVIDVYDLLNHKGIDPSLLKENYEDD